MARAKRKPPEPSLQELIASVQQTQPPTESATFFNPTKHMDRREVVIHLYKMMVHFKTRVNWQVVGQIVLDSLYLCDRVCDEDYDYLDKLMRERQFHNEYPRLAGNDAGQIVIFEA